MVDEELKQLLQKNLEASQESLSILRKMRRVAVIGSVFKFLKWVIIVGISLGAYYYIEPYIGGLADTVKQIQKIQEVFPQI